VASYPGDGGQNSQRGGYYAGDFAGPVDTEVAVENLIRRKVDILFCIGATDPARAFALYETAKKRGYPLSVVGVPKTIDNDVQYVMRTFGI